MFARRAFTRPMAAMAAPMASRRFKTEAEDDRWLEAVIDEHTKEMTNEERYAAQKQREVLKKMLGRVRDEHHEKVKAVEDKHEKEMAKLNQKLEELFVKVEKQ